MSSVSCADGGKRKFKCERFKTSCQYYLLRSSFIIFISSCKGRNSISNYIKRKGGKGENILAFILFTI
ncbi:MAG: hypothetical protein LBP59_08345 [Planctomycetaceae bacterium]|nr:hypothetical protein [Planctomycetaceae bacterium]